MGLIQNFSQHGGGGERPSQSQNLMSNYVYLIRILICLWCALCNRDCQKYLWLHFQKKRNYSETVLFCPLRLLTTAVIEPLERILSRPPLFLAIPYTVPLYTIPSMLRRTPRSNLSPLSIPLLLLDFN